MSSPSSSLTPSLIVRELNRYIVGQQDAKKAVAVALRNRWRRLQLPETLQMEIVPKNILMVGPTGVGKTEIARRLAKLVKAPFIKVEATKFTEIGYVGRDVEQIIRDLMENAVKMATQSLREKVKESAKAQAEDRLLDALTGVGASAETRDRFRQKLRSGDLATSQVEVRVNDTPPQMPSFDIPGMPGTQVGMLNLGEMMSKALGPRQVLKKMTVQEAQHLLEQEETEALVDQGKVVSEALEAVEQRGIVFLDEIDKICVPADRRQASSVSQEGVQRDLLPLLEGTTVATKYGSVQTDHILFIASGAFHVSSPSDLLPELQGRLPIRVDLQPLTQEDFVRILTEPEANLIRQAAALLETEGLTVTFTEDAVEALAATAVSLNDKMENIGARRLHTVLEHVLEELNFDADQHKGEALTIDAAWVNERLQTPPSSTDFERFIL